MARYRGKKSLYEVMGKNWPKSKYDKSLRKLHPDKVVEEEPKAVKSTVAPPSRAAHWPRKPKMVQFNAGRIEISLPYTTAIAVILGVVLVVLVVVRFDEIIGISREGISNSAGKVIDGIRKTVGIGNGNPDAVERIPPDTGENETVSSTGNNRIVIQTYHDRADLEPVKTYFGHCGIETKIIPIDNQWILVTKAKYEEKPEKPGTDGYVALKNIIELGAKYKAPPGYEPFGAKSFETAYGMKFDD
jgi:hypothetical protein